MVWEEFLSLQKLRKYGSNLIMRTFAWLRRIVERLMKDMNLKGAFRGRKSRITTPEKFLGGSVDLVCRNFTAFRLEKLKVADLTYVAMYSGFACVAFIIDVFAKYIVAL